MAVEGSKEASWIICWQTASNRHERANTTAARSLATSYHEPSLRSVSAYVPVSVEVPVATSETTSYFVFHTFSAAAYSNTGHMTQTRGDAGHMTQTHWIRVFISMCLKLLFLYLTMAIDGNTKLDHMIKCII